MNGAEKKKVVQQLLALIVGLQNWKHQIDTVSKYGSAHTRGEVSVIVSNLSLLLYQNLYMFLVE